MEKFSSCYFCGDALDASLDEYPVVPASVDPEAGDRRTIVLCPTCKRKLDPVVEAAVTAVAGSDASVDRSRSDVARSGDDGQATTEESAAGSDIESTLGDDDDVLRPVGSDSTDARSSGDSTGSDSSSPERERTYTSGQRAGGRPTGQGDGTDDEDDEADESKRDITLTRLENTNVMRLLRNREFPVDRDDFVTVAASAYEISPRHCEKVIDLAVKHDLLREGDEEGQLQTGSNWS